MITPALVSTVSAGRRGQGRLGVARCIGSALGRVIPSPIRLRFAAEGGFDRAAATDMHSGHHSARMGRCALYAPATLVRRAA